MFFRYFLILSVIALFSVAIHVSAEEEELDDEPTQVEERVLPAVLIVGKLIGSLFAGAAASCLTEAASECKSNWKNPGKAVSCAKNFLKVNKGRCAVGK